MPKAFFALAKSSSAPMWTRPEYRIASAVNTRGMPMAITGMPSVARLRPMRKFPTPAPGEMPVSLSWTMVPTCSLSKEAKASTATIISGFKTEAMPATASAVSTPVMPMTPAAKAATVRVFCGSSSGKVFCTWRVTKRLSMV